MAVLVIGVAMLMLGSLGVEADILGTSQYLASEEQQFGDGPDELIGFHRVVPQVCNLIPTGGFFIYYEGGQQVYQANVLSNYTVQKQPVQIEADLDYDSLYAVALVDQDYPSPEAPTKRLYLHWLQVNIPGRDLQFGSTSGITGNTVTPYQGPNPTKGFHRLVFALFEQRHPIPYMQITNRTSFTLRNYAAMEDLDECVRLNFFLIQPNDR